MDVLYQMRLPFERCNSSDLVMNGRENEITPIPIKPEQLELRARDVSSLFKGSSQLPRLACFLFVWPWVLHIEAEF